MSGTDSINGIPFPVCVLNSDGNGSKRSYNNYHTGEGVSTVLMDDDKVVDCEYKQNNDSDNGLRNHAGSVATAETREQLKAIIKKRYTVAALRALTTTIIDNNNVERLWTHLVKFSQGKRLNCTQGGTAKAHLHMAVCEVNDGLPWLGQIDRIFALKSLAHGARVAMQHKRDKDKERKTGIRYTINRKTRKERADIRQGLLSKGGWKKGVRPYKSNSIAPGQVSRAPVKRRASSSSVQVCKYCSLTHASLNCSHVKRKALAHEQTRQTDQSQHKHSELLDAATRRWLE